MNKKVYNEVLDIINVMDKKYKEKIPDKFIEYITEKRDIFYKTDIVAMPKNFDNLQMETKVYLAMIYRKYIKNTELDLSDIDKLNLDLEKRLEKAKNKKSENLQLVKKEESIFSKIKNRILKIIIQK